MELKQSVLIDLNFKQILKECAKFSHSKKTTERILQIYPSSKKLEIYNKLNKTDCLLSSLYRGESIPIEIFPEIQSIFTTLQIKGNPLDENQFKNLYKIIEISTNLKSTLSKSSFNSLKIEINSLYSNQIGKEKILKIFDDKWQISKNASPELNHIYNKIQSKEMSIDKKLSSIFEKAKNNNWLHGDNIQLLDERKVIPIKASHKRKIPGIIFGQSSSGKATYIEPIDVTEIKNQLIELELARKTEIFKILLQLSDFFRDELDLILQGYESLIQIDMFTCMAKFSKKYDCILPNFVQNNNQILIRGGKNPSLIIQNKEVIKLNFSINSENKIVLITGPNAGGKTVVLKTIGLFSIMVQSGFHIPVDEAKIPIFTKIFTDIGDRQSIENDLSTYSAHLNEISHITDQCDENTLILMDELGTGTDPDAGASLSQAIMEHMLYKKAWLIATTHLGRLKLWAQETKGIMNSRMIFNKKELMPTYEIKLGKPGSSFALEIASRMQLDKSIIKRAKELLGDKSLKVEFLLTELEHERREVHKIKSRINKQRKYIHEAEERIQQLESEAEQKYNTAEQDALDDVHKLILETRKDTEKLIHEIKSQKANTKSVKRARQKLDEKLRTVTERRRKSKKNQKTKSYKKNLLDSNVLIEGMKIKIPMFNAYGLIVQEPNNKGQLIVELNGKKLRLHQDQIIPIKDDISDEKEDLITQIDYSKPVSIQLDIRGKRIDEGIESLIDFLDGALVSGLQTVSILHGKGTGALQKAVKNYLKTQSFIASFQYAHPDSGGAGITEVTLK